jgi:hypothetical protein
MAARHDVLGGAPRRCIVACRLLLCLAGSAASLLLLIWLWLGSMAR